MVFLSLRFIIFLGVLLAAYYGMGRLAPGRQWVVLLVGSVAFYVVAAGWPTLSYMLATSLSTWLGSRRLAALSAEAKAARRAAKGRDAKRAARRRYARRRRLVFWSAMAVCLGMLAYVKYWNTALFELGLAASPTSLGILLPLGISFYTFTALSHLIDVYNDKYAPEPSLPRFLLFVSWFPQILQGPINRYDAIGGQLLAPRRASWRGMRRGALRLCYGLFKKYAIANVLVGNYLAIMGGIDGRTTGPVVLVGILIYSIQMYADFSGGIDMVEGVSELFGVEMAQNFRQPYFSTSLADYWRRWHMSLGSWMRDYVFYPLAVSAPFKALNRWAIRRLGKRTGRTIAACVANVVTFVVVGLWHGAEWHFLAWGLYNGLVIAASDLLAPAFARLSERARVDASSPAWRVLATARTMLVVSVGRYFDCMEDMGTIATAMRDTVANFTFRDLRFQLAAYGVDSVDTYGLVPVAMLACACVFVISLLYERGVDVRDAILDFAFPLRVLLYVGLGLVFVVAMGFGINQGEVFLYAFF